jgi:hypothetical protein
MLDEPTTETLRPLLLLDEPTTKTLRPLLLGIDTILCTFLHDQTEDVRRMLRAWSG